MGSADDRRFEVLRAIVADFVATKEPIGSKSPGGASQPGRLVRHGPQRHGGAGGRGLHHSAAHQLRAGAHREGLPRVRRPARRRQAAVLGRAERDPELPRVRCRPRRRAAPGGTAAGPADPPGGRGAVPDAVDVDRSPPGSDRADPGPAADGGHHRHPVAWISASSNSATSSTTTSSPSCARCSARPWWARSCRRPRSRWPTWPDSCAAPDGLGDAVGRSATVLLESLVEHTEERLLMGGTANLTRNAADFGGSLRSILEALEEQVVVLRLLAAQQRSRQGDGAHRP